MSNNTTLNAGSGGDVITDIDLANFGSFGYPTTTGKLPASAIYVSQAIGTIPSPLTTANPLPVAQQGALPAGANSIGTVVLGAGSAAVGTVTLGAGSAAVGTVSTNADAALSAGTAPAKALAVAAQYNKTVPAPTDTQSLSLQTDSVGNLFVSNEGRKLTYSASTEDFALAAAPTDIAQLVGSSTKTVKILKVSVQIEASAAQTQIFPVLAVKRSTAGSGFTSTATAVPHDSGDTGATASLQFSTSNPTTGTKVGTVEATYLPTISNPPSSGASAGFLRFEFRPVDEGGKPLTLKGTAQTLAINLGGTTLTGTPHAIVNFTWTESVNE